MLKGVPINKNVQTLNDGPSTSSSFATGSSNTLCHSELVGPVTCRVAFTPSAQFFQPGLKTSNPWLANTAKAYDTYKIESLSYRFVSQAPTTATGKVYMFFDHDVYDKVPATEISMTQMEGCISIPLWDNGVLEANLSGVKTLYTRTELPSTGDLKTYDAGKVVYVAVGPQVGGVDWICGQLWCDYVVTFTRPQSPDVTETFEITTEDNLTPQTLLGAYTDDLAVKGDPPFTWTETNLADGILTFKNYFYGYLIVQVKGTEITELVLGSTIKGNGTSTSQNSIIQTGALRAFAIMKIEASPGDEIVMSTTATTITECSILGTYLSEKIFTGSPLLN